MPDTDDIIHKLGDIPLAIGIIETTDGKNYLNYPWITPVIGYTNINGYRLPSGAKLIYKHPAEDFCYGEINLISIE